MSPLQAGRYCSGKSLICPPSPTTSTLTSAGSRTFSLTVGGVGSYPCLSGWLSVLRAVLLVVYSHSVVGPAPCPEARSQWIMCKVLSHPDHQGEGSRVTSLILWEERLTGSQDQGQEVTKFSPPSKYWRAECLEQESANHL